MGRWYKQFCERSSAKSTWPEFYQNSPSEKILASSRNISTQIPILLGTGIHFYNFKGGASPNGWRVSLSLHEKQVHFTSHEFDFMQGDHNKPEFLKINPRGKIPALKDGSICLHESIAIAEYLDAFYPQNPLMPRHKSDSAIAYVSFNSTKAKKKRERGQKPNKQNKL